MISGSTIKENAWLPTYIMRIRIHRRKLPLIYFFFLLPVGLSGTTVLRSQLRLLQGSPCHSLTLGGVWGWIWAPNWPKVGGAASGFEPRTSCMRVRSASHYATGAAPSYIPFWSKQDFENHTLQLTNVFLRPSSSITPGKTRTFDATLVPLPQFSLSVS